MEEQAKAKAAGLLSTLQSTGEYYKVHIAVEGWKGYPQKKGAPYPEPLDYISVKSGYREIGRGWREIDRRQAAEYLAYVIAHGIAYHSNNMREEQALNLVDQFLTPFSEDARFFTNWRKEKQVWPDLTVFTGTWESVSDSTFDFALCVLDSKMIGFICFEDED